MPGSPSDRQAPRARGRGQTGEIDRVSLVKSGKLTVVDAERHSVRKRIEAVVEALSAPKSDGHSDAAILCSLPGVGPLVAATVLSKAAQAIAARDHDALRAHAGVAPVTKRSGKRLSVITRHASNDRLRNALYHWARVSMQKDAVTKLKYASLSGSSAKTADDSEHTGQAQTWVTACSSHAPSSTWRSAAKPLEPRGSNLIVGGGVGLGFGRGPQRRRQSLDIGVGIGLSAAELVAYAKCRALTSDVTSSTSQEHVVVDATDLESSP